MRNSGHVVRRKGGVNRGAFCTSVSSRWFNTGVFVAALAFVLMLNGAVPFVAAPTLGQAIWLTGFSQAFSLDHMRTIYSSYVGYPTPMWIPFGLPVAYPAGFLIFMGMRAIDAYSAIVAAWLLLAFGGAYRYAEWLGLRSCLSSLAAALWMSLPLVWAHAGYSALSVGIALLPFYLYVATRVFSVRYQGVVSVSLSALMYWFVCLLSLFMDGYSFMMFVAGSSLIFCYFFFDIKRLRNYLIRIALPIQCLGLSGAYTLYIVYIGKMSFDPPLLDFFRGWGVDLTFWIIPTQGVQWFWDALGLSVARSESQYFGDTSVWSTSFLLPLMVCGASALYVVWRQKRYALGLAALTLFGLYMAMGPSLKIDSVKPEPMGVLMQAQYAVGPTGSAFLSEHLPGFRSMRAAYRWTALGAVGLWALLALWGSSKESSKSQMWVGCLYLALIAMYIPHLGKEWSMDKGYRHSFNLINHDLIKSLSHDLRKSELVAFLPYRNDFLVNYIAPKLGIRTYNVGGDKQLAAAKINWPVTMQHFQQGVVDPQFPGRLLLLLARQQADVVVLPYINLLWAAHRWPYPVQYKDTLASVIAELKKTGLVDIVNRKYYATVRLNARSKDLMRRDKLSRKIASQWCVDGSCLRQDGFSDRTFSQVGRLDNGMIVTNNRAGFLIFGPYAFMKAGRYRFQIFGSAKMARSAWCDVVSNKGAVEYGKFKLHENHGSGVLAEGNIILSKDVQDMEVRVYVENNDIISLRGYELMPVDGRLEKVR